MSLLFVSCFRRRIKFVGKINKVINMRTGSQSVLQFCNGLALVDTSSRLLKTCGNYMAFVYFGGVVFYFFFGFKTHCQWKKIFLIVCKKYQVCKQVAFFCGVFSMSILPGLWRTFIFVHFDIIGQKPIAIVLKQYFLFITYCFDYCLYNISCIANFQGVFILKNVNGCSGWYKKNVN